MAANHPPRRVIRDPSPRAAQMGCQARSLSGYPGAVHYELGGEASPIHTTSVGRALKTATVKIRDLPDTLLDAHASAISPYSVAITRLDVDNIGLIGSAVLAEYRGIHGLLTARHVIDALRHQEEFGVVLRAGTHRFGIALAHTTIVEADEGPTAEAGPDIGFVRLPDHTLGQIRASNSFVPLERHRDRATSIDASTGLWCLFGCPDERSSVTDSPGRTEFKAFGLACVGSPPDSYQTRGDFDYYKITAEYSANTGLPSTFGGVSGGGYWQTLVARNGDLYTITDLVLRGVAFYESERAGDFRTVKCHGPQSIYGWLIGRLEAEFSSQFTGKEPPRAAQQAVEPDVE